MLIEIEARLPAIAGTPARRRGTLEVLLDGSPVGRIVLGCRWSRGKIHLRFDETAARINRLSLRWPELPAAGDEALDVAIRRLEGGLTADVHPVFGELFSVRVGPSDDA